MIETIKERHNNVVNDAKRVVNKMLIEKKHLQGKIYIIDQSIKLISKTFKLCQKK